MGGAPANLAVVMGPGLGDVQTSTGHELLAEGQRPRAARTARSIRFDAKTIVAQPTHQGTWDFAGMDDHYFMSVALLGGKTEAGIKFRHYWVGQDAGEGRNTTSSPTR